MDRNFLSPRIPPREAKSRPSKGVGYPLRATRGCLGGLYPRMGAQEEARDSRSPAPQACRAGLRRGAGVSMTGDCEVSNLYQICTRRFYTKTSVPIGIRHHHDRASALLRTGGHDVWPAGRSWTYETWDAYTVGRRPDTRGIASSPPLCVPCSPLRLPSAPRPRTARPSRFRSAGWSQPATPIGVPATFQAMSQSTSLSPPHSRLSWCWEHREGSADGTLMNRSNSPATT